MDLVKVNYKEKYFLKLQKCKFIYYALFMFLCKIYSRILILINSLYIYCVAIINYI